MTNISELLLEVSDPLVEIVLQQPESSIVTRSSLPKEHICILQQQQHTHTRVLNSFTLVLLWFSLHSVHRKEPIVIYSKLGLLVGTTQLE